MQKMAKQISVLSTSCTMEIRGLCRLLNIFTTCLLNCLFLQIVPCNTENLLYILQALRIQGEIQARPKLVTKSLWISAGLWFHPQIYPPWTAEVD